jgi:acyl-[acyl carrier protein]--UDP-N-acetylglucosamine O-acyltransferase
MANGWTLTLRNFFIIVLKNAVNALIVNVGAWMILPANFNFHDTAAIWNMAKLAGVTVISRESAVWLPVLLKWSTQNAQPEALQAKLEVAEVASKQAAVQANKATDALAEAKEIAPKP